MRALTFLALASLSTVLAAPGQSVLSYLTSGGNSEHTTASWSYVDCGLPSDAIELRSLTVSPDPPVPGQNLTVTAVGYANEDIEDGAYADVVVKIGLIKLLTKRFDVCEEAKNNNLELQCPVSKGEHTVVHTVALPKEIPPARITVQVRGFTVDDDDMMCTNLVVDFRPKRPF